MSSGGRPNGLHGFRVIPREAKMAHCLKVKLEKVRPKP
jgi:hypothetical protein